MNGLLQGEEAAAATATPNHPVIQACVGTNTQQHIGHSKQAWPAAVCCSGPVVCKARQPRQLISMLCSFRAAAVQRMRHTGVTLSVNTTPWRQHHLTSPTPTKGANELTYKHGAARRTAACSSRCVVSSLPWKQHRSGHCGRRRVCSTLATGRRRWCVHGPEPCHTVTLPCTNTVQLSRPKPCS